MKLNEIKFIEANKNSYGGKRKLSALEYIVIHYTANKKDTAENNALYFKNGNKRLAGAHYFVDQEGKVVCSVKPERIAWAVGGNKYPNTKGASYYGKCVNTNSISIELCDNVNKEPSDKQIKAVKELISAIQKECKNAKTIIRHYDVTGKSCPGNMIDEKKWSSFKKKVAPAKKVKKDEFGVQ